MPLIIFLDAFYYNVSIEDIIQDIEKKHNIHFSYSSDFIELTQTKTIECKNQSVRTIISLVFKDEPVEYSFINNTIALRKIDKQQKLITFSGTVVDSSTQKTIAFATLTIKGLCKGTLTNEDGEFSMRIATPPAQIIISHLGYKTGRVYIKKDSTNALIKLAPAILAVEEVAVKPSDLYKVVENAYKKMRDNIDKSCFGKAYYKQKTVNNDICSEYVEGLYEVKVNQTGLTDWDLKAGRYFLRDDINMNDYIANLNFTWFYTLFSAVDKPAYNFLFPVSANVQKYYDLKLMGYLNYNNKLLSIIGFNSKTKYNVPAFQGYVYIDEKSGEIYCLSGELSHPAVNFITLKNNLSTWENYSISFDIFFSKKMNDVILPDYMKISHSFDHIQPNKFNRRVETKSSLLFYEYYPIDTVVDFSPKEKTSLSDFEKIKQTEYNDEFWANISMVKRTLDDEKLVTFFSQSGLSGDLLQFFQSHTEELPFTNNFDGGFNPELTETVFSDSLCEIGTYIHSSSLTGIILNGNSPDQNKQTQAKTILIDEKYITYNGSPKNAIYGDPFLFNEWYKGNVNLTENRVISNIDLKYDCVRRSVYCKDNGGHVYRLNNKSIENFTIFSPAQIITLENVFINTAEDSTEKTQKFLTVIYKGEFSLYMLQEKYYQPATYQGMGYDNGTHDAQFFEREVEYYIKGRDNKFYRVKLKRNDILKTLTNSQKESDILKDYSRSHHFFFGDIYDVARVLRYYGVRTLNADN